MEMRIALLYTVWTGDDMDVLKRSIEHHEPFVDGIFIFFQEISNKGEYSYQDLPPIFDRNKLSFYPFHPDLNLNTKENERIKHNRMIQLAKQLGFTHFILCACDHFYDAGTFATAKNLHRTLDLDVTFTKMITYYKNDNWALWPLENYYMPFTHKIYPETYISKTAKYPVLVDPSVKVNTANHFYAMTEQQGILHHFSMVRKDIKKKFRNAASSIRWNENQVKTFISEYDNAKIGDKITYFKGAELTEIGNVLKKLGL